MRHLDFTRQGNMYLIKMLNAQLYSLLIHRQFQFLEYINNIYNRCRRH